MKEHPLKTCFCSVGIGMSEADHVVQFILKAKQIDFRYVQDSCVTPPAQISFEEKVRPKI